MNLKSQYYCFFLAEGLGYHGSNVGVTPDAVHMTHIGIIGAKSNILTQLHGGFMIIAWLLCASTGMFTARYYKQTHTDFNPINKAFWFVVSSKGKNQCKKNY